MISYDVLCPSRHRSEVQLASMFDDNPACPACGEATSRVPAMARIGNSADAGPSRSDMPNTWHGINRGDKETVRGWHRAMTKREKLEEKYPELAGDRRPVLAHEGAFHDKPLRAGDDMVAKVADATFSKRGSTQQTKETPA